MRATRTYLQLLQPADFRPAFGEFPDLVVRHIAHPTPALYRRLYRGVGEAYHWRDRWNWDDAAIIRHLAQPEITLYTAERAGALAGWYELRRVPEDGSVEIAYFGLFPGALGQGLGKHLLSCAVRDAWALAATRVWLHTCTLDHPHALPNYVARGFTAYRTEHYEVDSPIMKVFKFEITRRKVVLTLTALVVAPLLAVALWTFITLSWSYSRGERAGYVQKFSQKGWLCKTWEGELAMVNVPGAMQEKFQFSVRDEMVASYISGSMGKRVSLTYEQHKGVPTNCFGETDYYVTAVKVLE